MSDTNKKPEVIFAPGCFDSFDGTQEELDALMLDIQRMVESGEFMENSIPLDPDTLMQDLTEEEIEELKQVVTGSPRTLQ